MREIETTGVILGVIMILMLAIYNWLVFRSHGPESLPHLGVFAEQTNLIWPEVIIPGQIGKDVAAIADGNHLSPVWVNGAPILEVKGKYTDRGIIVYATNAREIQITGNVFMGNEELVLPLPKGEH